ncbi:cobaltochelatase subunit CobN, partial [filamentous cyanobacterium CCP5]
MHRLTATPGGWTPDTGVLFLEQSPAPLVFLTAADTEIQCLSQACRTLPEAMPAIRAASLLQLQQQITIDGYAETVLAQAQIIVLRLLGGRAYWSYGLEVARETAAATGAALIVLPGDDQIDPDLISHSTVPLTIADGLWRYLKAGGPANLANGLMWVCDRLLATGFDPAGPREVPKVGVWPGCQGEWEAGGAAESSRISYPTAAILFYRAHYLAGNTAPIQALADALTERGLKPLPVYVSSLQDPEVQGELLTILHPNGGDGIDLLLNTTSFSVAKLNGTAPQLDLWQRLDVPVLQVILSGGSREAWQANSLGLSPRDVAMNVALPEVDGRIITRAVSFKGVARRDEALETDVVAYEPVSDRVALVADLAQRWVTLRQTPTADRRVALILANYPNRDGRLANGVGLDTPQSCIEILKALQNQGYVVENIPASGDDLIRQLTTGLTNDPEGQDFRQIRQTSSLADYQVVFDALPEPVRRGVSDRWGTPQASYAKPNSSPDGLPIPGIQLGNIFVGIQPSRGYDLDPSLNYHAPDLEPTHTYLAYYAWLRHQFQAQAIVHVGKHGNLEWLPGKGIGLSTSCYPEAAFGPLPHLYPFIVNDPGEGAQAKRRAQAVIIDHLTPPLTRAELYGPLEKLEALVDEYYEAQSLNPRRLEAIGDRIVNLLQDSHLLE